MKIKWEIPENGKEKWKSRLYYLGGNVGFRILLTFSIVIIAFFLLFGVNEVFQRQFSRNYEKARRRITVARSLRENIINCSESMMQYLKSSNGIYLSDYDSAENMTKALLERADVLMENEDSRLLLTSMNYALDTFFAACRDTADTYKKKDHSYYTKMYELQKMYRYIDSYSEELVQVSLEESMSHFGIWERRKQKIVPWNTFLIILLVLLFVCSNIYITMHITMPVDQLITAARRISQGDLDVKITMDNRNDEVGLLEETFQQMVDSIRRMLEFEKEKAGAEKALLEEQRKNEEFQRLLEQTRFLALQSQINPHFMFNTLNSIKSTVMTGRYDEALSMLDAFAAFMRYTLRDTNAEVTLREELKLTKEYVKIQQIRFGDRISFHMRCDETLLDELRMPKFTLQPLVENAIIHGLEKKVEAGYLKIDIRRIRDIGRIRVFDNGAGMSRARLHEVITQNFATEKRVGVGNIRRRLELYTGNKDAMRIFSMEGAGTMILIEIPLAGTEKKNADTAGERHV